MRRFALAGLVLSLVGSACAVQPLADPGLGTHPLSTTIYAADGSVLATWYADEQRTLVPYEELPQTLIDAVVAIEDERYWQHPGIDLQAMARALLADVEAGQAVQGGSTITQQYLKNVVLSSEVSVDRKIEEAILALRLEEGLDKKTILERYLNTVYFGAGAYGVGTAAAVYFGKDVRDLDLAESALLAGLIRAPSASNPFEHPDVARARRRVVLDKMVALGWAGATAADRAAAEPLHLRDDPRPAVRFPYFVAEVRRRLLANPALGATRQERYDLLTRGGLSIHTTLDPTMQRAAEEAVASVMDGQAPSAALAAIEPSTGHVVALVGGRGYDAPDDPVARFDLATQGRRPAGSAFKPFVLAAAFEHGFRPDTVLPGGRSVTIDTASGPWTVTNYDGAAFPDLTLTEATVYSVNVVYARLVDLVGPAHVADLAEAMGIRTDLQPYPSIALGAQDVSVLDMASAYGTFANGGTHVDPVFVTSIEDADAVDIYREIPARADVLDQTVADEVTAALTEVVRRGTGQQARIGRPSAGKTGTTQNHADAWFVGYTPQLAAAVWVGFPTGEIPMVPPATPFAVTGGTWPAWIWSRFASAALAGVPYGDLAVGSDQGLVAVDVDVSTGFLAGPLCPRAHVQRVYLPADRAPTIVCPVHNPTGEVGATLPDVTGLPMPDAVRTLDALGLAVTVTWDRPGPLTPGTVIAQDPPAGSSRVDGPVRLELAGPQPGSTVPLLIGLPLPTATARLDELDVPYSTVTEREPDPAEAADRRGIVWKQTPPAGAGLGDPVTLWVNP